MRRVAIISQPLRAWHCRRFLAGESSDNLILTTDVGPFWDLEPEVAGIVVVKPPSSVLPTARLLGLFENGSSPGPAVSRRRAWVARSLRRLAWRFRYLDRLTMLRRSRKRREADNRTMVPSFMKAALEEQQRMRPIQQIVVFDLFDLPMAVGFAQEHDVEVLVR